jgi:GTPase
MFASGKLMPTNARLRFHELRQLVETLEWAVAGMMCQNMSSLNAASLIGPGKLEELVALVKAQPEVDCVVFDHELTTSQVRNIRDATGVMFTIGRRHSRIFHRHARTKEAQLQVELARLKYLAPSERVTGAKERPGVPLRRKLRLCRPAPFQKTLR